MPQQKKTKSVKAWAVKLPGTNRISSFSIAHCPDDKENDICLKYDIYERKAAAEFAAKVYPEIHRQVIQVLITPITNK